MTRVVGQGWLWCPCYSVILGVTLLHYRLCPCMVLAYTIA